MPSKITVSDEPAAAVAVSVPAASAPPPPAQPPAESNQPVAIDADDDSSDNVEEVQEVQEVDAAPAASASGAAASKKKKKKKKKTTTKKSKAKSSSSTNPVAQDTHTTSGAKTVTPKKDGKKGKAGRPKKDKNELPPNQRTLGSFFGAAAGGAKKETTTKKPAAAKSSTSGAGTNKSNAGAAASNKESTTAAAAAAAATGKGKKAAAASKKTTKTATKKAAAKRSTVKSTPKKSTAQPKSDKIKAIVVGSALRSKSSPTSSSKSTPTPTLSASDVKISRNENPITSIPTGVIQSQKQIRMQEEKEARERQEKERLEQKKQGEKQEGAAEKNDDDQPTTRDQTEEEDQQNEQRAATANTTAPRTPAAKKKKKKAKKRATLIPVVAAASAVDTTTTSAANADYSSKPPSATASTEVGASESDKAAMELDDDDDDATNDVPFPPTVDNVEDGESLHSEDDDVIMSADEDGEEEPAEHGDIEIAAVDLTTAATASDNDDEAKSKDATDVDAGASSIIDTAAKGSAVEGAKVRDMTFGDETSSGADEETPSAAAPADAQDVSKRLSFTPKKKAADGGKGKGKGAIIGGLDAFTVPISSIKTKKKIAKKTSTTTASGKGGSSYVNKRIAKEFDDGIVYRGTVTKYTDDGSADGLWHVKYDDGDEEDFSLAELEASVKLFEAEAKKVPDGAKPAAAAAAAAAPVEPELSEEFKAVLAKNETLRKRYRQRAEDLVKRSTELVEEDFDRTVQPKEGESDGDVSTPEDGSFPEGLRQELAVLIQGSPLPLSTLTVNAVTELAKRSAGKNLTADIVSTKIKIMAARKQYLTSLSTPSAQVDKFEDTEASLVWRWELTTLDLLPSDLVPKAKKAQGARRKLQNFHKAVVKLLASLDKADVLFLNAKSPKIKRDAALAKISTDEDKVLKYEREEEKQRLAREAKAQKEAAKLQKQLEKQKEKQRAEEEKKLTATKKEEEKKLAAAKREEERERKKQEAVKAKEEAKLKREEEKAAKKRKAVEEAKEKEEKQKARMMSFFGPSTPPRSKMKKSSRNCLLSHDASNASQFDSDAFWKTLDTSEPHSNNAPPFKNLSDRAKESRKRKTKIVSMTVFATVLPDNPFEQQPYDEERTLKVPNKYKFLGFHEDYRPPYHGTWSKPRSSIITGRNPLGRDTAYLDYDVDSEAEWEEGDDEDGEDCDVDGPDEDEEDKVDDEEGDTRVYNYDDGWLAQDDEYDVEDNEDNDEETMAMRKKKAEEESDVNKKRASKQSTVCVVAPAMGGIPLVETGSGTQDCPELVSELVDGADPKVGLALLSSHEAFDFVPCTDNCLDLFPATKAKKTKQKKAAADKDGAKGKDASPSKNQANKEMSQDDLRAFAKFVHNCTLGSKDKVVEELQTALPDVTSSRAQATRKLDSIAEKRRLKSGGGFVWEVKKDILESLGLEANDLNPAPVEKEPEKKAAKSPKRKKSDGKKEKDPNAPKRNMSSFMFYSNANRSKVREENPEAGFGDVAKIISKAFKELSAEEKKPYEDMAADDKERYKKEMEAYDGPKEPPAKKAKKAPADGKKKAATKTSPKPSGGDATKVGGAAPSAAATVTPKSTDASAGEKKSKKRSPPAVSEASKNLFAAFLSKKKKQKTDTADKIKAGAANTDAKAASSR